MIFKLEINFDDISSDWGRLYELTPEVSPFLEPEAFKIALKYFYPYYLRYRCRPKFGVIRNEKGRAVCILPLICYHDGKMQLFGFANGFNESGMLFENEDALKRTIELLKVECPGLEFLKIDERNPVIGLLPPPNLLSKTSNAAIYFADDFNAYFKSLSSSVRQNIRTAYNRMAKDGHTFCLDVYRPKINKLPTREVIDLYCKRHGDRYGVHTSMLKKWFLKHQSFATKIYELAPGAITCLLRIDGKPAAFLSGLGNDKRLIVPRLSINNEFRRYSPGMVLIAEAIKYLIADTTIRVLDLSQGDEQYKYQLGAVTHYSYVYTI